MKKIGIFFYFIFLLAILFCVDLFIYDSKNTIQGYELTGDLKEITFFLDGKEADIKDQLLLESEQGMVLLPVSIIPELFSCSLIRYQGGKVRLEKGEQVIELALNTPQVLVNGETLSLLDPLIRVGEVDYISVELFEKGLFYKVEWKEEQRILQMEDMKKGQPYLPSRYDYRLVDKASDPKNQGTLGTCWAFASLRALESRIRPMEYLDFSEDHMSLNNGFSSSQESGGEYTMSMAYLLSWAGPVLSVDDPYGDGYSPSGLKPVKHVQEIQILPEKDYEAIKRAVYLYGGVQSSLYTPISDYDDFLAYYNEEEKAYSYIGEEKPNHDSVIIGWDDHYKKENFNVEVEGDGAFICMNSWGNAFGEEGYFYVSYYDTNIANNNIVYTKVEDVNNYDSIYQTDLRGWVGQIGYGEGTTYFSNVYEANQDEVLAGVGFYATGADTEYEVHVIEQVEGELDLSRGVLLKEGTLKNAGYYTIPVEGMVEFQRGQRFAVVIKIRTPGVAYPVAVEYQADNDLTQVVIDDGEGYISIDGDRWERVEEEQQSNICLKVYTKSQER